MPSGTPAPEPVLPAPAPSELRGGGLRLRPLAAGDESLLMAMSRVEDIVRWTTIPAGLDVAAAAARLERLSEGFALKRMAVYAAELDGVAVGTAGVHADADGVELFYALLPEARMRGLATTATELLTRWALAAGALRVCLLIFPDNVRSHGVAERAGFTRDGTVRRAIKGVEIDLLRWCRA